MTRADILAIAAKHGAYPDCTPTLRGEEAIVAFAREVLAADKRPKSGTWSIDRETGMLVVHHEYPVVRNV